MKQLLFYYLYFIGASLILFECAKLFPSSEIAENKTTSLKVAYNSFTGTDFITNGGNIAGSLNKKAATLTNKNSPVLHSGMLRINGNQAAQSPYLNFDSLHLNNTHRELQRRKE